jgi:hypothetical protein
MTPAIFTDWKFTRADELWGQQPIQLQHRLNRHPLFTMDRLAALIERYPVGALPRQTWRAGNRQGGGGAGTRSAGPETGRVPALNVVVPGNFVQRAIRRRLVDHPAAQSALSCRRACHKTFIKPQYSLNHASIGFSLPPRCASQMKGTAMRQHVLLAIAAALDASGITVKALAEKVGVTPSSVYNWLWRSTPPAATRDKLPMTIKISGRGMQLETMISIGTARNVVECINDDPALTTTSEMESLGWVHTPYTKLR